MMPSFDAVNYSLRPSKSIQRQLMFEGIRRLQAYLNLDGMVYIGFGSIWFTDFVMAHRLLRVYDMVSIEGNEVGYRRALFNSPYATVQVKHGWSNEVLPTLFTEERIRNRPWMVWLDYDFEFNESAATDLRLLIENAPMNSIVAVTFNGSAMKYGAATDRPARLREVFGAVVPDELSKRDCKDERMQETLADLGLSFMRSVAADLFRPGGFTPAFRVIYKDTSPMVTIGGVLPARGAAAASAEVVAKRDWPCFPAKPIVAPHLTIREAATLQSKLPAIDALSRPAVQALGFDLDQEQIETFQTYYNEYPAFGQILV